MICSQTFKMKKMELELSAHRKLLHAPALRGQEMQSHYCYSIILLVEQKANPYCEQVFQCYVNEKSEIYNYIC